MKKILAIGTILMFVLLLLVHNYGEKVQLTQNTNLYGSTKSEKKATNLVAAANSANYISEVNAARNRFDTKNPLSLYRPTAGLEGRNKLDEIYSSGLIISTQSASEARTLLARGLSAAEKVAMARILGALYTSDDSTGYNADLLIDLKQLIRDDNKEVARSATLSFARVGYLPGSESVLRSAFRDGIISSDDYFGELAHFLRDAPHATRNHLISELQDSGNGYGADILSDSINRDPVFASQLTLDVDARAKTRQLLQSNEPAFSSATGDFGMMDAIRFNNWLRAIARLDVNTEKSIDSAIIDILSQPKTDPRKIIAYLLTPEASGALNRAGLGSPVNGLVNIARNYSSQYPTNKLMSELIQDIEYRARISRK